MRIHRALVLALVACGSPPRAEAPPPPPPPPPSPAEPPDAAGAETAEISPELATSIEDSLKLLDELGAAAERAGKDCDRMATELNEVLDGPNGKAILESSEHAMNEAQQRTVEERYGAELDRVASRFYAAAARCETHEGVNDAIRRAGFGEE